MKILLMKEMVPNEKQILESLLFASKRHLAAFERKISQF